MSKRTLLWIALVALFSTGIYDAMTASVAAASMDETCCSIRLGSIPCDQLDKEKPCWSMEDCGDSEMWACCLSEYCNL